MDNYDRAFEVHYRVVQGLEKEIERLRKEVYTGIATIAKYEVDTKHLKEKVERLRKENSDLEKVIEDREWKVMKYEEVLNKIAEYKGGEWWDESRDLAQQALKEG